MRSASMDDHSRTSINSNHNPISIYHERQSKQLCALHTLNNLFQDPEAFTKQDLDAICRELAPNSRIFNPHRSALGLGCYDINVIISALSKRGFDVKWFDKRRDLSCLKLDKIYGFILNVPNIQTNGLLVMPLNYLPARAQIWYSPKHWISIRKIESQYYNLDSKLPSPVCLGDGDSLLQFLRTECYQDKVEILVVVTKDISESHEWLET